MQATVRIITDLRTMSFYNVAKDMKRVIEEESEHKVEINHIESCITDSPKNIILIGTLHPGFLNYGMRYEKIRNTLCYFTVEGVNETSFSLKPNVTYIANSKFSKECAEKMGINVSDVIWHGVDLNDYSRDEEWEESIKNKLINKTILFTNANNDPRKGLDKLLIAFKMVERVFLGDDFLILHTHENGYYSLRELAKLLEIENLWITNLMGGLTTKQMNSLYHLSHIYVNSSMAEGFCLPLIEALKWGLPIVTPAIPTAIELLGESNSALLFPTRDIIEIPYYLRSGIKFLIHNYKINDLADTLIKLLLNTKLINSMKEATKEEVKKFDCRKLYKKFIEYLK
ncbi:MAG: glycosyltransferase family 4 protein [Nitrososphaerales archaeon]